MWLEFWVKRKDRVLVQYCYYPSRKGQAPAGNIGGFIKGFVAGLPEIHFLEDYAGGGGKAWRSEPHCS